AEESMAWLLCDTIRHDRNQWLVLSHTLARGRPRLARSNAEGFRVRLESLEVHHPLEAPDIEVREFDCADANAPRCTRPQSRGGAIPVARALRQELPAP